MIAYASGAQYRMEYVLIMFALIVRHLSSVLASKIKTVWFVAGKTKNARNVTS